MILLYRFDRISIMRIGRDVIIYDDGLLKGTMDIKLWTVIEELIISNLGYRKVG